MALFDFLLGKFQTKAAKKPSGAEIPLFSKFLTLMGRSFGGSMLSGKDGSDYYEGWVFACVRAIAEEVSQINLQLFKTDEKGNKELVMKHPAIESLQSVNSYFTKHQLFERLQSNLELEGAEYWFIQPADEGGLFEIYPLISRCVQPVLDAKTYVASYNYNLDNSIIPLNADQVIPFRNFNPKSDVTGKSTLSAVRSAVDTDDGAKAFNKAYFKNNAMPSVVLEYPQALTPEQITALKTAWSEEYAGAQNGHKTAVASDGLKITTMEVSHSDMEFIEGRRFSRDEILAIFRVPKIIVGIMEDVNRASAEAALYAFMRWTIMPKMRRIVDTLNEFYLPLFGDSSLRFEFTNKPPEDSDQLTNYFNAGIQNGWLSPNDIRRTIGLPELVDGEKLYLPLSLVEYTVPIQQKSVIMADPVHKGLEVAVKNIVDVFAKEQSASETDKQKEIFEKKGEAKSRAEQRRRLGHEKLYAKTAKKLFAGQKERALEGLVEYLKKKSWRAGVKAGKIPLLDRANELSMTIDLFSPVVAQVYEEEGQAGLDQLGLEGDEFDINTPDIKDKIKKNTQLLSESMTDTTIDDLNTSILEGLEAGEAIADLTKRIQNATGFDSQRAEMIARTETARSGSEAEVAAWDDSGVVGSLVWWTAQDERVDSDCADLHGTEIDIGDSFISSSELEDMGEDDYTGDGINTPPLHPNCRCTIIPMLKEKSARIMRKLWDKTPVS